jgi:hypothetical protein
LRDKQEAGRGQRSIYFPPEMDDALEQIGHLKDIGATKSLSAFICEAIIDKLNGRNGGRASI